jgi:uncharacterized repeat protein (TIGR02543 family)
LNNDTLLYVFLSSAGTASQAQIGDYDIIPSQAFGVGSLNYDITYRPAKLKVIQKPLQVTALNAMKDYGDDDRELKFSAVDKRGVSYQPILFSGKLARDSGETVGVYKINKGTLTVAPSYSFNFTQGELTINKAMPSIAPLFSGGNAMSLISDIIGSKNGNYPKGNIIVKIKDVNIDTTAAVIDGVAKSQITELPNHMVQVEISYPGDEHYLPTSITIYVYALVYHSNGGRMITPYINFDGNQSVKIENPSNYGNLMFAGWYENEDFSGPEVRRIPAGTYHDVQLYAKWIPSYEDLYIAPLFNQVLAVANPLNHPFLANSTFKWYKDGELLESSKQYCGFENLIPSGKYKVEIYYLTQPPILLQLAYNSIISKSKAYPNPLFKNTTLSLNSEFANQDGVEVEVTNLIGVRIKSIVVERKDNRFIINGFERSGIYLLRIIDNGELKETHKVIVED